ncbi:MAG: sensor histidine kinase, partial [Polyangiaceae bacterium]
ESSEHRLGREIEIQRERARGLTRLMEQQDHDRRRVARDLHDGIGQLLVVLKGVLAGESSSAAERARDLVSRGIDEARALSHGLHPDRLDRLGLTAALKGLVDDLPEQPGLTLDAEIREVDGVLERSAELHVFRIAQEAINNAFVHGSARTLYVSVELVDRELLLVVENDGRRFNEPRSDDASPGLGLTSIKERCAALGATLTLERLEEGGTRLEVSVPLGEGSGVREATQATVVA